MNDTILRIIFVAGVVTIFALMVAILIGTIILLSNTPGFWRDFKTGREYYRKVHDFEAKLLDLEAKILEKDAKILDLEAKIKGSHPHR